MMLTANLVGFVTGVEGMKYMGEQVFGTFEGVSRLMPLNFTTSINADLQAFDSCLLLVDACLSAYK